MKTKLEKSIEFDKKRLKNYEAKAGKPLNLRLNRRVNSRTNKVFYCTRPVGSKNESYVREDNLDKVVKIQEKAFFY